jgi:hypothetical protein
MFLADPVSHSPPAAAVARTVGGRAATMLIIWRTQAHGYIVARHTISAIERRLMGLADSALIDGSPSRRALGHQRPHGAPRDGRSGTA